MKNVLKLAILPIESVFVFIIEFHVGLKIKNPQLAGGKGHTIWPGVRNLKSI